MPEQTQIPRVLWAQQREHVLLTIAVPDIDKVGVKFEEDSVSFQGHSASPEVKEKCIYAVKIDLYEKIDPENSKYENIGQKFWRLLLKKKDKTASFWPRLTKDKTRLHWLQTDFDHWKDEDESDDEKPGFGGNFQDMFSGGMGDMPGMDLGDGDGSDDDNEEDSDDEKSTPMKTDDANVQNNENSKETTGSATPTGEQESEQSS